jgi:GNAT superfamily N-acetyltransferase
VDKGRLSLEEEEAIHNQLQVYFPKHLKSGSFMAMIAWQDEKPVSAAFLLIQERPANPSFLTGITGILVNVITYPEYRKRGMATRVIKALIKEAKKANVISIDLAATEDGKGVYEKLGFTEPPYTAMRLKL